MKNEFLNNRVIVKVGDITQENTDVIANAANSTLLGGGGVDGAIHLFGGKQILEECREIRRTQWPHGLPTGEAVLTTGGLLPARYVIHTVGPVYGLNEGRDAELLGACYRNSLKLAVERGITTIAFPSISTGAYRYPRDKAALVSSRAVADVLNKEFLILEVRLVFFSPDDSRVFLSNQQLERL